MRPALYQAAAHCLDYPDHALYERIDLMRACAPELTQFLDHLTARSEEEAALDYVRTFDFHTRHSLYLTWWLEGDTRRRGSALVDFARIYREYGVRCSDHELPDYLPLVLEFVARTGHTEPLIEHRPALELLRLALVDSDSPYAVVLAALCESLPGPSPRDRAAVRALAAAGPRAEAVGLAPYGHLDLLPVVEPGAR